SSHVISARPEPRRNSKSSSDRCGRCGGGGKRSVITVPDSGMRPSRSPFQNATTPPALSGHERGTRLGLTVGRYAGLATLPALRASTPFIHPRDRHFTALLLCHPRLVLA